MSEFIKTLSDELREFQDDTSWLVSGTVEDMVARAAAGVVEKSDVSIRLVRLVDPEDHSILVELHDENGLQLILTSDEVSVLRALLATFDEHAPARVGEPYTVPTMGHDGKIYATYDPKHTEAD